MTTTTDPVVVAVCRDGGHRFSKPVVAEITRGLDLLALPRGTVLRLGPRAVVEVTGLRNPCNQINNFRPGLLKAVVDPDAAGRLIRKAGLTPVLS